MTEVRLLERTEIFFATAYRPAQGLTQFIQWVSGGSSTCIEFYLHCPTVHIVTINFISFTLKWKWVCPVSEYCPNIRVERLEKITKSSVRKAVLRQIFKEGIPRTLHTFSMCYFLYEGISKSFRTVGNK
jgi:hypothetical protein